MFGCCGVGSVEGVEEGGVEGAEGEFVDYVGEVECCDRNLTVSDCAIAIKQTNLHSKSTQKTVPL